MRDFRQVDVAARISSVLLLNVHAAARDRRTKPNYEGLKSGEGCIGQMFTLRRVSEHSYKFQQPTVACYIDFRAAFGWANHESLWELTESDNMPLNTSECLRHRLDY